MSWTLEKENKLKELWEKGHTASQIAGMIGNTTRNAVIGKAHRLNLAARAVSKKSTSLKTKSENIIPVKEEKLSRKAKFKSLLLDKNFEPENPKSLEELTDETCRWPIGHPPEESFHFCGRKSLEKFPYCKLHVLYAFQPKNAKEEDIVTEEDIPQFIEKKIKSA
jgi:GcrA cell cycle regulator